MASLACDSGDSSRGAIYKKKHIYKKEELKIKNGCRIGDTNNGYWTKQVKYMIIKIERICSSIRRNNVTIGEVE